MFLQAKRVSARRSAPRFSFARRSSGLLLHPTSLPGPHGSGDIGKEARKFADFCAAARQRWWQMLPVSPPGAPPGNSPYSSYSTFAGSPYLIDLHELREEGLLCADDLRASFALSDHFVNFTAVHRFREKLLRKAFAAFDGNSAFESFRVEQASWLDDFALFSALKHHHRGAAWTKWDRDLRMRKPDALRRVCAKLAQEIEFHKWVQFVFDRQWRALRKYCNDRGVGLIGDIPIFVAHDSADVWARPELFLLDRAGNPKVVSGYPPDDFNVNGQRWGHPHYDWPAHRRERFAWWIARFRATFRLFDAARIDHFLGFHRVWTIPARARTAATGKWTAVPGAALFEALRSALGELPVIAEDLGLLTKPAQALRKRFGFPGMRVMQFGFGADDYHLPHRFVRSSVVYPGTHDNETIVGWFEKLRRDARKKGSVRAAELRKTRQYLKVNGQGIHWAFIRAAMSSRANTTIFQVQDILGLDSAARMNVPGTVRNNWRWRLAPGALTERLAHRLRTMVEKFERLAK